MKIRQWLQFEISRLCLPFVIAGAVITLAAGICSSLCCDARLVYRVIVLPRSAPPAFVFPLVWTVLYLLIGAAAGGIAGMKEFRCREEKYRALLLFVIMMIFNCFWFPLFFGSLAFFSALIDIAILLILTFFIFFYVKKLSFICALAFVPYFFWLLFAFSLNFSVLMLN